MASILGFMRTLTVSLSLLIAGFSIASAATLEQKCQQGRYTAISKYAACETKATAKLHGGGLLTSYQKAIDKCGVKFTALWPKLQAKYLNSGVSCDTLRFTDNGDGTITDNLTGRMWEKKTTDASIHDVLNTYGWTSLANGTIADGTVFTTFLDTLNTPGSCFATHCDWRLPTIAELAAIRLALPCSPPCVDPIFIPNDAGLTYWTSSSPTYLGAGDAWTIWFQNGDLQSDPKDILDFARAVR